MCRACPASIALGRALLADQLSLDFLGQLAAVVHEEAARAGELVCLAREDPHRELLVGQVSPGQLERLGQVGLVHVHGARGLVLPARLQLLETVLGHLVIGLAGRVVIGRHGGEVTPDARTCGGVAGRVTLDPAGLCPVAPPGPAGSRPGLPGCASAETSGSPRYPPPTVQGVALAAVAGSRRVHAVFTVVATGGTATPVTIQEFPRTVAVGSDRERTPAPDARLLVSPDDERVVR